MKKTITILTILCSTFIYAQKFAVVAGTSFTGTTDGSAHLVDIDGDGDLDFFNTGDDGTSGFSGIAELYKNDGTGVFTLVEGTTISKVESSSAAFADLDGDGDQDLILTGTVADGKVAEMYTNDGLGNFTLVVGTPFLNVSIGDVEIADLDGDSDLDIIISGFNFELSTRISAVYKNDGSGNFSIFTASPAFALANEGDVDLADVDGDGDLDLLITGDDGPSELTKLYLNDGNGVFIEDAIASALFTDMRDGDADFADIDGDGDQDLLICGRFGSADREAILYTNNGSGVFSLVVGTPFFGANAGTVNFFDVDNDGDKDVLISGYENTVGNRFTRLYNNDGTGIFTEETSEAITGINNADIAIGDVNGDGFKDIIITGYSSTRITEMYLNTGASLSTVESEIVSGLNVYPNPTSGVFHINSTVSKIVSAQLFDVTGRILIDIETSIINITELPTGVYMLKIDFETYTVVKRIIKK